METLMRELDKLLKEKNERISVLEWQVEILEKKNEELKNDIEKYKESEVNRA